MNGLKHAANDAGQAAGNPAVSVWSMAGNSYILVKK
jgi:hypothetical protein